MKRFLAVAISLHFRKITWFVCIATPLCLSIRSMAQADRPTNDHYTVQHFGEAEGLQNTVYSILPDKDGFLWLGTSNGLARFNGDRILPVITSNLLFKKRINNIGLLQYKGNDTIIALSTFLNKIAVIAGNKIVNLEELNLEKHGLLFYNQKFAVPAPAYITGNFKTSEFGKKEKWDANTGFFAGGVINKDTIWLSLREGIGFYNEKGLVRKITIPDITSGRIVSASNHILYLDNKDQLNYVTQQGLQKKELFRIPGHKKLAIYDNRFGEGFYCVADSCLYAITIPTSGKLSFRLLVDNLKNPADILVIAEKDSNTIVTGTFSNGLYLYKKSLFTVSEQLPGGQSNSFFTQQLLPDNRTILTGDGFLFRDGLYYSGKVQGFDQVYFGIFKDSKGRYWYPGPGRIVRTSSIGKLADTIKHVTGNSAEILLEDKDSRLWISSDYEFGYFQNDIYTEVTIRNVTNHRVNCMRQDSTGNYYFGTDWGLFTVNNINQPVAIEIPNFRSMHIRDIIFQPHGLTWIFTYVNGFFLLSNHGVTSFADNTTDDLNFVHTLIEDGNHYCWLPSNNGLFVTTIKSLLDYATDKSKIPFFYRLTTKDGFRSNEFNGGTESCWLRLSNGNISLTSMDGLVQFNPYKMHFSFSRSPVLIDQVLSDSVEIKERDALTIGASVKNIHFSVSTSNWGNAENDILEYQLMNKDMAIEKGEWLRIDPSGTINLFTPAYGSYQLIIRKRTGFGASDYLYKTISLSILSKWYQTKLFYSSIAVCVLLAMTGIFYGRRNYYRAAQRVLEEKVALATLELQQLNHTLEKKVEERTWTIQEAEKRFRALVEKSMVGVYIVQEDKYVYVNPRYEELLGYTTGELQGANALVVVKKDQQIISAEKLRRRVSGESESEHYEITGVKKDGTERQLEFFGNSTMYEGKPTVIGTMLDITEKKLLEQAILEQKVQEQKKVTRAILQGEEKERNKLGQELHDNINQILAVAKLYLSSAKKPTGYDGESIATGIGLIENAIAEIRVLSHGNVTPLKEISLAESLQNLIDTQKINTTTTTTLLYNGSDTKVTEELKLNIYRIVQEQLNNILKYAAAGTATVSVVIDTFHLSLSVSDDGKGFDTATKRRGTGISNMINRVESFNGTVAIESSPGHGCSVQISFPLATVETGNDYK